MAKPEADNRGFEQLKQDIKLKKPANFYIFYGEEAYLRAHWLDRLHKLLVEPFAEAFNYHRLTSESFSVRALIDSVEAMPMMAERSLVQVDDSDFFKLPEDERSAAAALLSDLPDTCTLVLVYETTAYKPDKRQKKLADAMGGAVLVEFKTPSERELAAWIARHFKSHGKQVSYPICQYLIQATGGDMSTLSSEIEKVAAFASGAEITRADVDAVVEPVLEAVVFTLSDAVAAGRYDKALQTLETLLQMQEEPIPILGAISGQMRRILTAKTLIKAGKGVKELMSLCGISSYPAQKTMDFARRLPDRFADRAVLLCLQTDAKLKTPYDEPERLLELLVFELAQEAQHA